MEGKAVGKFTPYTDISLKKMDKAMEEISQAGLCPS
jgi:hypothetical protein